MIHCEADGGIRASVEEEETQSDDCRVRCGKCGLLLQAIDGDEMLVLAFTTLPECGAFLVTLLKG